MRAPNVLRFLDRFHVAHAILDNLVHDLDTIELVYTIAKAVTQEFTAHRISISGRHCLKKDWVQWVGMLSPGRRALIQHCRT